MAWTDSRVFRPLIADMFGNVAAFDLDADQITNALYNNSITPNNDVTAANSAYNVDQWATANEIFDAGFWDQGGEDLANKVINAATADVVFFDADDTSSAAGATMANIHGCLIYDNTLAAPVANQGICYLYLGGPQSVTAGVFTVAYNALGIVRATL